MTNQGPYLQINEDGIEVDLRSQLYLIFDGFGGSNIGDKTVAKVKETIKKFYTKIGGDPDSTLPFFYSPKYLLEGNALINSMHYAHSLIKKDNFDKNMSERGGSSAIGAALAENILTMAATGNCAGYLYRKGHLEIIARPDSLHDLSVDDYNRHFFTAPMSGFGLFDDLHLEIHELRITDGDMVLLMTDGAYARLDEDEIKYVIEKKNATESEKIGELFSQSNSRGNLDNQSAVILQF